MGNVQVTATGVAASSILIGWGARSDSCVGTGTAVPVPPLRAARTAGSSGEASMSIGSARRDVDDRAGGSIPGPRTAADAYRVSDDQIHRARLVVARNCDDPDDLRQ